MKSRKVWPLRPPPDHTKCNLTAKSSPQPSILIFRKSLKKLATFPINFFRGITKVWEGGCFYNTIINTLHICTIMHWTVMPKLQKWHSASLWGIPVRGFIPPNGSNSKYRTNRTPIQNLIFSIWNVVKICIISRESLKPLRKKLFKWKIQNLAHLADFEFRLEIFWSTFPFLHRQIFWTLSMSAMSAMSAY